MLISKKEKYLILGAGLSGLSTAYHLKDKYAIFEKERTVGGLCRTMSWKGFYFDFSGHLLHMRNKYVKGLVSKLLSKNLAEHQRHTFVYYKNKFVPFPFQANLMGMPPDVVRECLYGLVTTRCSKREKDVGTFEGWVNSYFGRGFAKHFFVPYNEKIFGTELKNISSEWCDWFIPKPDISQIVAGAFEDQVDDFGYNATFCYPRQGGIQVLPSAFAERVKNIQLSSNVDKIFWKEKKVSANSKIATEYEHLVSTIPLPEMLKCLDPFPEELRGALNDLKWRSVHCLNIGIKKRDSINRHWIYFPEPEYVFYRVGFTHNFSPKSVPDGCSSLYIEMASDPGERSGVNRLFSRAIIDLNRLNIIAKDDKIMALQHMDIPYAYVIYDNKRQRALKQIKEFLSRNSIYTAGRYADWKYSFMEESILDGKKLAEKLLSKK